MASSAAAATPTVQMPDSSSSGEKHDVFINFRGKDTRDSFTSHLHAALLRKNVDTYRDTEKLETGDEIAPALLKAIELSKIAVIIFSQNYAESNWCLDELAHILETKKKDVRRFVIPVFYKVKPSDVRHQINTYATALKKVKERFKNKMDKVEKWIAALETAGDLSGLESTIVGDDSVLVEKVVQKVLTVLNRDGTCDLTGLVGIESRIREIESLLCIDPKDDRVRFVGIIGMGGIGKSTLADAVYHQFSPQYNACYFLANVREESERHGLNHMRNKLLCKLLGDDFLSIETSTTHTSVKVKLRRLKVLVVLDDVSDSSQLEFLAGSQLQFGKGSRIIITSRDRQPLRIRDMQLQKKGGNDDMKIYEVEKLKSDEALELFHMHASCRGTWSDSADYKEFSKRVVSSSLGIPLAVKIWGSLFLHCKSKDEFECVIHTLERFPNKRIHNVFKISYDGLEENEKEIFLDIACFYKGEEINDAKRELNACGFFAERGIGVLIDMSLVEIKNNHIWMHDLIQQMGREIVREQCTEEPGKRSRLYTPEDVRHVLEEITGTGSIRSLALNSSIMSGINLSAHAFRKMHNLRYLKFCNLFMECSVPLLHSLGSLPNSLRYLCWHKYPFNSLPSKFSPHNLVEIQMPNSEFKTLWNEGQAPRCLKRINLSYSTKLVEILYLSNSLESINLNGCTSLVQVPDLSKSVNIRSIYLQGCTNLVEVPSYFQSLHSLTSLNLGSCSSLINLPDLPHNMEYLDLDWTALEDLPLSIWSLEKLIKLNLHACSGIKSLPRNIWKMNSLKSLDLAKTSIGGLPSSIQFIAGVVSLELKDCTSLVSLPTEICKLIFLKKLSLSRCCNFRNFPEILEPMGSLEFLGLSHTDIEALPSSVEKLFGLKTLVLSGCRSLVYVPKSIYKLKLLKKIKLDGCCKLEELPSVKDTSILDG